jgi:hypothetical protein
MATTKTGQRQDDGKTKDSPECVTARIAHDKTREHADGKLPQFTAVSQLVRG